MNYKMKNHSKIDQFEYSIMKNSITSLDKAFDPIIVEKSAVKLIHRNIIVQGLNLSYQQDIDLIDSRDQSFFHRISISNTVQH